ncbi:MAG: hypothetical protein JOZ07_17335 [Solirubrobacterales bacterium]|nr:hypothetical protein [Solirubrobacterales bacterium]
MSAPRSALALALEGLRARRRRAVLSGLGIAVAAATLSVSVVIGYGLGTGFHRATAAAGLPDVIVRFDPQAAPRVAARIAALPDVARYALRLEVTNVGIGARGHQRGDAVAEVLDAPGTHQGYAVLSGHDLGDRGSDVLVEQGLASAWGLALGDPFYVDGLGPQRVVGFAEGPDDVGYPLGKPRFYLSRPAIDAQLGAQADPRVDLAEIWLRNPAYLSEVLVQARATSFGLHDIRFATRSGLRILIDQAAGIVIDLLVALSLIALMTAGVMLAVSARAEVQRRLGAIGVRRAVGATRAYLTVAHALEATLVALPAASLGVLLGGLATVAPAGRLETMLNEPAPRWALAGPLLLAWLAAVLIPSAGAAWPAWRAAGRPVARLLRGADVASSGAGATTRGGVPGSSPRLRGGLVALGARMVAARRARLAVTIATLGLSAAFVLLLLALASELSSLETDPGALGKRYALTAALPPSAAARVRRIPGVLAAAPRYEVQGADSFDLGETIDVIAYPGDHTTFEAPALVSGRRLRGGREAEVGAGLATALGLTEGSTLALALADGSELRLRVAGVVSSLDDDGRVAYIPASALLGPEPAAPSAIAVVLAPGADVSTVLAALTRLGAAPTPVSTAVGRGVPLVDVLRTILRAIAIVDGLVCLYALVQACALTVQERRPAVAVMRAGGGGVGAIVRLLAGAALAIVTPAAVIGVLLERGVLGPALSHLAESYATLPLGAGPAEILAVLAGLALVAAVAVVSVALDAAREPVIRGLAT